MSTSEQSSNKDLDVQQEATMVAGPPVTRSKAAKTISPVPPTDEIAPLPTPLRIKVDTQLSRLKAMKSLVRRLPKVAKVVADLEAIQRQLDDIHKTFAYVHYEFEKSWPAEHLGHPYFKEDVFFEEFDLYMEASSQVTSYLAQCGPADQNTSAPSQQSPQPVRAPRLPDISLPKFDGSYSTWPSFRDMFTSLIIDNPSLTQVERLHYLRASLAADPLDAIVSMPITSSNFPIAWDKLKEKYDNSRLLIAAQFERLLAPSLSSQKTVTHIALSKFVDEITNALRSLEALGEDPDQWNHLLVFIIMGRLDFTSRSQFENSISNSTEFPDLATLMDFLQSRIRALQWIDAAKSNTPSAPRAAHHATSQPLVAQGSSSQTSSRNRPPQNISPKPKSTQSSQNPSSSQQPSPRSGSSSHFTCDDCGQNHYILKCAAFRHRSPQQQLSLATQKNLCYNCLGRHKTRSCMSEKGCRMCGDYHHTWLHSAIVPSKKQTQTRLPTLEESAPKSSQQSPHRSMHQSSLRSTQQSPRPAYQSTLLATANVIISTPLGKYNFRALIDSGSELSFVTEDLVQQLSISRQKSTIAIIGINNKTSHTKGMISLTLYSTYDNKNLTINAHILSTSFTNLPSFSGTMQINWPHLQNLRLADPDFMTSRPIHIILGADVYGSVVLPHMKKGPQVSPTAQLSIFGWLILGPVQTSQAMTLRSSSLQTSHLDDLHRLLVKFWEQEEVVPNQNALLSPDDQTCEDHFRSTHSRLPSGKYMVRLPLCSSSNKLGCSRKRAFSCLQGLLRKFDKNPEYGLLYKQFMAEYENLNHMQVTSSNHNSPRYFLPHHGVLKSDSSTTKLRVVFNGSSPTTSGYSLNDIMHTGAKLQLDLIDVLFWVRRFKYVFSTDITKMYRQILVHPDDWNLQCILWPDSNNQIKTYHLTTVTYGTRSAPFIAIRVLLQLIEDEGHRFPLAIPPLTKGRYVDDIYGGADTQEELFSIADQLQQLCMAAGLPLAKWQSNVPELLKLVKEEETVSAPISFEDSTTSTKILGLLWHTQDDHFSFKVSPNLSGSKLTKRIVLSQIAQIFDPLGLVSPVTIRAKMLLQELWLQKLSWDQPLEAPLKQKWCNIREDLNLLASIRIPRWINTEQQSTVELHGFSDASQFAMAAVLYIVARSPSTGTKVTLLCSKTKVTPLKPLSIPRLELSAALLLAHLVNHVYTNYSDLQLTTTLWTDSSVTLSWIKSPPHQWKDFVRNRVASIQELTPWAHWRYVSGKENPADCASRGLSAHHLTSHSLWWTAPSWLSKSPDHWPSRQPAPTKDHESEVRCTSQSYVSTTVDYSWNLIYRYSSLHLLIRITALCYKAISKFRKPRDHKSVLPLTPSDLETSRIFWIKQTQQVYFSSELKTLQSNSPLPQTHPFSRLTAYLDSTGIIRVGGRISQSDLNPDSKHPAILPRSSQLTKLVIDSVHRRTLHGGTQLTLATIRQLYWIIGGRAPVKSHILKCVTCARHRGIRAQQLMGQLPESRVRPSRPFLHTGLDYAGPISIKTWKGRGAKIYKGWVCVFVCFSTSAVHLEVVSDYTSESFIAAYRRFTARRGLCHTLYSDCGTNFIGADSTLKDMFRKVCSQNPDLIDLLLKDSTKWNFNPPAAPHMGGKWEAVVKSFKHHFNRTVQDHTFTLEEVMTLLAQIEAILNSRPLEPLSDDPDDCSVLTPGHFLIGAALNTLPEPSIDHLNTSRLSRWQFIQQRTQQFWSKWSTQYLQRQLSISKWHHPTNKIKVGTIVLITDERTPPCKWPLGRITSVHPGKDGLIRVVTIKTATSTLTRPVQKLSVLPISTSDQEDVQPSRRCTSPQEEVPPTSNELQ